MSVEQSAFAEDIAISCPDCDGAGIVIDPETDIEDSCPLCDGRGLVIDDGFSESA